MQPARIRRSTKILVTADLGDQERVGQHLRTTYNCTLTKQGVGIYPMMMVRVGIFGSALHRLCTVKFKLEDELTFTGLLGKFDIPSAS